MVTVFPTPQDGRGVGSEVTVHARSVSPVWRRRSTRRRRLPFCRRAAACHAIWRHRHETPVTQDISPQSAATLRHHLLILIRQVGGYVISRHWHVMRCVTMAGIYVIYRYRPPPRRHASSRPSLSVFTAHERPTPARRPTPDARVRFPPEFPPADARQAAVAALGRRPPQPPIAGSVYVATIQPSFTFFPPYMA